MASSSYGQLLKDLQVGFEEGEKPVHEFLRESFGILTTNVGEKKLSWDLEVVGLDEDFIKKSKIKDTDKYLKRFINKYGKTFEIKRDKASDRTGNFFYEVWSNISVHNPGCINSSAADTVVIVRNKEFIFINRGYFISWAMYNLYHNSPVCKKWKKKTCRRVQKVKMKSSHVSPDVRGILIPMEDIKKESCIDTFKRNK